MQTRNCYEKGNRKKSVRRLDAVRKDKPETEHPDDHEREERIVHLDFAGRALTGQHQFVRLDLLLERGTGENARHKHSVAF